MKKTALLFSSMLLIVSSCNEGTGYKYDYTLTDSAEYSNESELFKDGATVFFFGNSESASDENGFLSNNTNLYFCKGYSDLYMGGFCLSKQSWEKPSDGTDTPEDGTDTPEDGTDTPEDGTDTPEEGTGSSGTTVPGEYSVYGTGDTNNSGTANTFFYFRQTSEMPEHDIAFPYASIGTYAPVNVSVCNSAYTVRAIRGDNVDDNTFDIEGDYILTATGYLNGSQTGMYPARLRVKMAASSDAGSNLACNGPSSAVTPSTSVNPVSKKGRGTSFASSSCVSKLQVANSDAPMIKRLKKRL